MKKYIVMPAKPVPDPDPGAGIQFFTPGFRIGSGMMVAIFSLRCARYGHDR
jgi:hypothetical protein